MCITANKIKGARAILARDVGDAKLGREDNDANILCLGGRITTGTAADKIVDAFLKTNFLRKARFKRRIEEIEKN